MATMWSTATRSSNARVPRSLTVIGAGVIGIEYATIFSAMDVPVTLIEPRETFLDFIDREIIDTFTHELRDRGMVIAPARKCARSKGRGWLGDDHAGRRAHGAHRDAALRRRPHRRDRPLDLDKCGLSVDHRGASRSIPRPSRPRCRTSMRRAT
jgi:NAD(P) transhydrogenase